MKNTYELQISSVGTRYWYYNNLTHRDNGPAIEYKNGDKFYYKKGHLSRLDGPSVYIGKNKYYYINNIIYLKSAWAEKTKHITCHNCLEFCKQICF